MSAKLCEAPALRAVIAVVVDGNAVTGEVMVFEAPVPSVPNSELPKDSTVSAYTTNVLQSISSTNNKHLVRIKLL